ncbi:MAG: lamin tail domain-containing protein, partial [Bacteroidales bacterium]
GMCVNIFSSNSALSNVGATLILKNTSGNIIHSVAYSSDWYQDPLKENGGWSLEMIDPENPCGCLGNWRASTDTKGGTPGSINSVHASNPDDIQPYIKRGGIISDSTILVEFSEPMDSLSLNDLNQWILDNEGFTPIKVSPIPPSYISAYLSLYQSLKKHIIYYLSCRDNLPADCVGNSLDTSRRVKVGIPDSISTGDIVINEILPNPETSGEKFIELFNRSEKVIDLHQLAVGLYDSIQNTGSDLKPVSENGILSFPGDYSVLTKDPDDIKKRYYCPDPDAFLQMSSLPSISNDEGSVVLVKNNDGTLIDHITYSKAIYSDLLTTTDGVSLERINPSLPSLDITNWHSASESCGFATPGYRNSEFLNMGSGKNIISLFPSVFTPDDDGKDDVLVIHFTPDEPGYLTDINIFDVNGHWVRSLVQNRLLSTEDAIMWDGRDDRNLKSPLGIYILIIDLFKPKGTMYHLKKTCVLGGKR